MSRTILELIIKMTHREPSLITSPLQLKQSIEQEVGHPINSKSFLEKYKHYLIKEK